MGGWTHARFRSTAVAERVDWLNQVVRRAQRIAQLPVICHRDNHDRDLARAGVTLESGQHRPAIHARHA